MFNTPGRIAWLAVLVGYFVDTSISLLIGSAGQFIDPELARGLTFATRTGTIVSILLVLSTGVGGWLSGRLAKHEYVLHGTLVGGIGIIFMLLESLFGTTTPFINIVLQCVAVCVGAFGGWLSQWIPTPQKPEA